MDCLAKIDAGNKTTVLGMTPLVLDAFFVSMAVTIMAGLTFATLLTTCDHFDSAVQAWQLGADVAVSKPLLCGAELTDAITGVMRRSSSKSGVHNECYSLQQQ